MSAIKCECIIKGFTMLKKIHKYFSKFADFLGFFTISAQRTSTPGKLADYRLEDWRRTLAD